MTAATAQTDVAARFDMTLADGNTVIENVSGQAFAVNHNLAPENIDGAVGKALRLDGYSTYVNARVNAAAMSTSALSVSLWCAPETYPMMNSAEYDSAETWIVGNLDDAGRTGFAFTITPSGEYGFKCYTGGWAVTLSAADGSERLTLPRYEWSHLVATIDAEGRQARLYRNGELVAESRCMSPINVDGGDFLIGKSPEDRMQDKFLLNTFNGLIDDITIYNKVLTQAEAAQPEAENPANLSIPASRHAADIMRPVPRNARHGVDQRVPRHGLFKRTLSPVLPEKRQRPLHGPPALGAHMVGKPLQVARGPHSHSPRRELRHKRVLVRRGVHRPGTYRWPPRRHLYRC